MPKDPTKNIFQYKIRGGHLNEFEFQQNQGDVTEQHDRPWETKNYDPNAQKPAQAPKDAGKVPATAAGKRAAARKSIAAGKGEASVEKKSSKKSASKATKKSASKTQTTKAKKASKKPAARKGASTSRSRKAAKK